MTGPDFELTMLGQLTLTGPGGPVSFPHRKVACLLGYLAFHAPRPQPRERLAELLWGSNFDIQAKQNLRQSLFRLRKVLGPEAIVAEGETAGLAAGLVGSDVSRFEHLVAKGTPDALRKAIEMYRGPLLDGVAVTEEAWVTWLGYERDRLQDLVVGALVRLGEVERRQGQIELALSAAQRAVALNPLREDAHRQIIVTLGAAGRRAEALKHYQDLVALLQRELGADPDADTMAVVAELRGAGADALRTTANGQGREAPGERRDPAIAVTNGKAPALHASALPSPSDNAPLPQIARGLSLIVLPFTYLSTDDEHAYFADAMTEVVTSDLSRISGLTVIATTTAGALSAATTDLKKVCRDAGARFVLAGSIQRSETALRITAQFVDGSTGARLWSERFDGDGLDPLSLQDQITGRIAVSIGRKIETVLAADSERMSSVPGAIDLLFRGIAAGHQPHSRESLTKQEHYFREAIRLDPASSEAHARLARAISLQLANQYDTLSDADRASRFAEAKHAASRSASLNPSNPQAHIAMGLINLQQGDFAQAMVDNELAIALNRNIPRPYHNLGACLMFLGQPEKAISAIERAMRLDPLGPNVATNLAILGYTNLQLGRVDAAHLHFLKARATNRALPRAYTGLAVSLVLKGDVEGARLVARELKQRVPAYRMSRTVDGGYPSSTDAYRAFYEKTVVPAGTVAGLPL